MELLQKYFPYLSELQVRQFKQLEGYYREWNEKINVISRRDIDHLYERHVLHSLAIAKFVSFKPGTKVMDAGTGGGFPGIPLAILFPDSHFTLIDATGKKIKVVHSVIASTEIKNATAYHARAESLIGQFDFMVSRAVAPLQTMYGWTKHLLSAHNRNEINNGWLMLKGGDLSAELRELNRASRLLPVSNYFEEPWFKEKYIVYF